MLCENLIRNKWLAGAFPALLLHICVGTVYCWSLLESSISFYMKGADVSWAFSLTIFFLGISAAIMGPFVERYTKRVSYIGSILFSIGMLGSGWSCYNNSILGIYLFYGVIMGIGTGLIYIVPIKTLALWFKNRKGLYTGLAITGFGLAKFIGTPIMINLMDSVGISNMFIILGFSCLGIMLLSSWLLQKPKGGNGINHSEITNIFDLVKDLKDSLKLPGFILLWIIFYINITCGLSIISSEKEFFLLSQNEIIGVSLGVELSGIMNALGRLEAANFSDRLNGNRHYLWHIILLLSLVGIVISLMSNNLFWATVFIINIGYGAGFSIQPSLLSDLYGNEELSRNHGIILSAWAFAGLTGNQLTKYILDIGGNYRGVISVIGILYFISLILSIYFVYYKNNYREKFYLNNNR